MLGLVLKCNTQTNRGETECGMQRDKWVDEGVTVYRRLQKLSSYYFISEWGRKGVKEIYPVSQIRMRMRRNVRGFRKRIIILLEGVRGSSRINEPQSQ